MPNDLVDFSIDDTVVRKKAHMGAKVICNVVDVEKKQYWAQDSSLGDSRDNRSGIRVCSIDRYHLGAVSEKGFDPV